MAKKVTDVKRYLLLKNGQGCSEILKDYQGIFKVVMDAPEWSKEVNIPDQGCKYYKSCSGMLVSSILNSAL